MRNTALILVILFATVAAAKDRQWVEAIVAGMGTSTNDAGVAVLPVGTGLYGVRIQQTFMYYRLETPDMTYVLSQHCEQSLRVKYKCPLDVTLHGKTRIALDGRNVHVLDDAGKDVELQLVEKIARTPDQTPAK
jgi:hypothetical protein